MPTPRIDARPAAPQLLSLAKASQSAKADTTFAVDQDTAVRLVGRIPADSMGLRSARLELGKEGWQAEGSGLFLEVVFPSPVKHIDGPFARAFVDVEKQAVWQKAVKAYRNPPADLMGEPRAPRIDVGWGLGLSRRSSSWPQDRSTRSAPAPPSLVVSPESRSRRPRG